MRWKGRRQSDNVEDRRGMSPGKGVLGGGMGLLIVIGLVMCMGGDPTPLIQQIDIGALGSKDAPLSPKQEEQAKFISVVLADTEDVWNRVLQGQYREPTLVLFEGRVASACGMTSSAVGPFYCPGDQKVYIDLTFFRELAQRFGAPGDFAQAYVLAHEVGHHVQKLLGVSDQVTGMQRRARSQEEANALSVRLELQADCFAGVYAHHNQRYLEPGDLEEGLRAAAAIGDDMIQKKAQGYVAPESWTHGSSEMRVRWFREGFESGDPQVCDTFDARRL